jgi:3-methyladenine DNA glycosylase Mpg
MDAPLTSLLFWGSLMGALLIAGVVAFPVNRWLIARGKGTQSCIDIITKPHAPAAALIRRIRRRRSLTRILSRRTEC